MRGIQQKPSGGQAPPAASGKREVFSLLRLVPLTLVTFVLCGVYSLFDVFDTTCGGDEFGPIGYVRGGQPESLTTAALLGAAFCVAAGAALWRYPRWRRRILASAIATYAAGLGLLWAISPAVWGAGVCPGATPSRIPGQVGGLLEGHTDS